MKKNSFLFAFACLFMVSIGRGALTDGLVHYYTFDDGTYSGGWLPAAGSYKIDSAGTAQGTQGEGKIGQGMGIGSSFAGRADMAGEYFHPGTGDWTLGIWVKQASTSVARGIVARGAYTSGGSIGGWQVVRNPEGTLTLNYVDGTYKTATSTAALPDDTWGYLNIRRKGDLFQLLLNGASILDVTLSSPIANIAPVAGSTWNREFRSGLTGDIVLREGDALDELAVWTRALSDSEISWLYNDGDGRSIPVEVSLRDGLQQYFPLDSDFVPTDGQGNLTTIGGDSTPNFLAPGKFGSALAGSTGKIRGTATDNARFSPGTGNFTVALWFKPSTEDVPEGGECIIAKGAATPADHGAGASQYWNGGWNLRHNVNHTITLRFFVGTYIVEGDAKFINSDAPISADGEWVHLAYTRNGTTVTLYVNGQPQTTTQTIAAGASISVNGDTWGRELDSRAMRTGEMIDELAFWNRALSAAELQTLAAGTASIGELTDPGAALLKRTVSGAETWSTPNWFTTSATDLPWSNTATGAEITFSQLATSMTLDVPVTLESLFLRPTGTAAYINLLGSETLSFGNMGSINTISIAADQNASFNLPVTVGVLDLFAHGAPAAAASQWMGRACFENIAAETVIVRTGLIDLPDSATYPNHQIGLINLFSGTGAVSAQNGTYDSTYTGDIAFNGTAYLHVRDTAASSPDAKLTLPGKLYGTGTLLKHNTGTLALTGTTSIAGSLEMVGGTTEFSTGTHTLTDKASVQAATLAIGGDARLTLGRLVATDGPSANSTIRQTGGDIVITGTNNAEANTASIILTHWNALSTYSMTGGSLSSASAKIRAIHGGTLKWDIENATVSAPGIYSNLDNTYASTITLNNGAVMTLGAAGIILPTATTFTLGDGATLTYTAASTNNKTLTFNATGTGATINLGGNTTLPGFAGSGKAAIHSVNPATLALTADGEGSPLVILDNTVTVKTLPFSLELTGGATETNWQTLTGGVVRRVADLSLLHTPGDSIPNNSIALYTGRFHVSPEQAGTWYFAGTYDDNIMLTIDGAEVFVSANYQSVGSGSATLAEGWHAFEIRARDITGADGPSGVADWKAAVMALGYRVGTVPSNAVAASEYTRFSPENLTMEASPLTVTSMLSGGAVQTDYLKLTQWRVHLGADEDATRITTFDKPLDLTGATVSFTADATTIAGGYVLGTFLNADKATFTGLPPGFTVRIEANGRVSVGNFGLRILLF